MSRRARNPQAPPAVLSARQHQILALLAQGRSNKEIAVALGLTVGTVKQHLHALFRKLDVSNRTMAVVRGSEAVGPATPTAGAAGPPRLPASLRYSRRLVTAMVVEPRPGPVTSAEQAMVLESRMDELRRRAERLAFDYDARGEPLPSGASAVWFGQPVTHGDDAQRALALADCLAARAAQGEIPGCSIGIATVSEIVAESEGATHQALGALRQATRLAAQGETGASHACELTVRLAGTADSGRDLAQSWGGLPFVPAVVGALRRGRAEWVAVESWPPEAGTRLIGAVGSGLAAAGLPVYRLWMPAARDGLRERLMGQLQEEFRRHGRLLASGEVSAAMAELAASGPCAVLAYGIDALATLTEALGSEGQELLQRQPVAVVIGAMHRAGEPQTVVRMLGPHPGRTLFARVLRLEVPASRRRAPDGIRPDVQALLDTVSPAASALARLASQPATCDVDTVAKALGLSATAVLELCRELEASGLLSVQNGKLCFRDPATAAAVRASVA